MSLLQVMEKAKNSPVSSYHSYLLNHKYPLRIHTFLNYPIDTIPFHLVEETLNEIKFLFYRFELAKTNSRMVKRILSLENKNSHIFFLSRESNLEDLISENKIIKFVLDDYKNQTESFYEILPLEQIINESDWNKLNEKRIKLIWKRYHDEISKEELSELEKIQKFCQIYINKKNPLPIDFIKNLIKEEG